MVTITVTADTLPDELRDLARRDVEAVHKSIMRTVHIDAMRWIQWSIRGGDAATLPQVTASLIAFAAMAAMLGKGLKAPRSAKKPKQESKSVWSRLKERVESFFADEKTKRKRMRGEARKLERSFGIGNRAKVAKAPPDPCVRRSPPFYRVPIDVGDYARSWRGLVQSDGTGLFYNDSSPPVKAGVIEEGRRPGRGIPIEPLAQWVRRKFGCRDPEKAEAIAMAISRRAKHHGRPGLKVLARAHPRIAKAQLVNLERSMRDAGKLAQAKSVNAAIQRAKERSRA